MTGGLAALARSRTSIEDSAELSLCSVAWDAWNLVDVPTATLSADEGDLSGDEWLPRTLFENLFRNAVDHGGDDIQVRVGSLKNGFYVEYTVMGLLETSDECMFEHGFSTSANGRGIGLSIVDHIATAHDLAIILLESEGGGARFEFRKPYESIRHSLCRLNSPTTTTITVCLLLSGTGFNHSKEDRELNPPTSL